MNQSTPCPACGEPVPPKRGRGGRPRKWCSEACRVWAYTHRRVEAVRLRQQGRLCPQCGEDMSARRSNAKYCSLRCGEIARGSRRPVPLPQLICAYSACGKSFVPTYDRQRCCSERCGKRRWHEQAKAEGRVYREPWNDRRRDAYHRRRAQMYAAPTGETVRRDEIAARDAYRCHLCRKRVDMARVWPDPLSPTLDHLVPLSKGGAHEPANVRLAHAECNLSKGNRPRGEQLLLIG